MLRNGQLQAILRLAEGMPGLQIAEEAIRSEIQKMSIDAYGICIRGEDNGRLG